MFHIYAEIFFQYINFHIILFSLNFILLILLSRTVRPRFKSTKASFKTVFINSFLRMCIHQSLKHSLVRELLHNVGINDWDIQPFGLSTLFYPSSNFQFPITKHSTLHNLSSGQGASIAIFSFNYKYF